MITDLRPIYESDTRTNRAVKRARAEALAKGFPVDQYIFTKVSFNSKQSGSPKHREKAADVFTRATAALVGSPLVVIDPESRDVTIYTVAASEGTSVQFEGDDEFFDLADFPVEWRLFDPALQQLAEL